MNTKMVQFVPYNEAPSEKKDINVRDTVKKHLYHWPLFVSVIALCLSSAFLYIRYADRVYEVKAQLLFKNEETGDGQRESALQELDIVPGNKVVENEMEILKSRILMRNVVQGLQLNYIYQRRGIITDRDLYTQTPVRITSVDNRVGFPKSSFLIRIIDDTRFILKQNDHESEMLFTSRLKTKTGVWSLEPTKYLKRFIGETISIRVTDPDSVVAAVLANFKTEVISRKATVVQLSLEETVPQRGKDILNRLIEEYNMAAVQDNNRVTESTLKFIDERLAEVTGELNSVEKEVERFKSSKGLTDISSQASFFLENVTANDRKLNEVNVEIQVLDGIGKYINSPESGRPPATVGISDPALVTLINQLISLEFQREQLLASTPEGNPLFDPINRQLFTTRESIKDIIRGIKSSLLSTRRQLQSYDSRFVSSIKDLPGQEREYLVMERQQGIKEELYVYLLKKREEAALSYASTLSNSRIVDTAFYGNPISPNIPLTYAVALLMGFILPVGFIFGRDILNNRVLSSSEVVSTTSAPLLGELVYHDGPKVIVMNDRSCRIITEQFRALRTNLQFAQGSENKGMVTMLTSSMSGEGKSFITYNLGVAFSASGHRTIVLEMDMRKPTISKYFKLKHTPGLSDFLNGLASKEDIIQSVDGHPNLFVIGAGELPANPSEILEEPRIKILIEWLRRNFDEVLIDTPPIQLVTDGMIISQYCDIQLYVIRQGFTYKSHLEYLKQIYQEKRLNKLYVIFNGVDMKGRYSYSTNMDYNYYTTDFESKRFSVGSAFKQLAKRF